MRPATSWMRDWWIGGPCLKMGAEGCSSTAGRRLRRAGQRMRFVLPILPTTTTTTTTRQECASNEGQETLKSPWGLAISYRHGPSLPKLHGANNEKMVIHADSSPIVTLQIPLPETLGDEAPKNLGQKQEFRRLQRGGNSQHGTERKLKS